MTMAKGRNAKDWNGSDDRDDRNPKRKETAKNNSSNRKNRNKSRSNRRSNGGNQWRGNPPTGNTYEGPDNALSWYTRYASLTNATANVPFPNRPGMTVEMGSLNIPNTQTLSTRVQRTGLYGVPGVMVINWVPAYGSNPRTDSQNPLTVAANETYALIRSNFSGDLSVDPPDIMMYELAQDSIFMLIAKYKKIFRLINAFTPDNYIIPDGILVSMGFSGAQITVLRKQKVEIWKVINTLVAEIRKFRCPGFMDVMNRHYWLSDNVYTDADSINSQFYVFNLAGVYKLVQTSELSSPLQLQFQSISASGYGTSDIAQAMYDECHSLINALASWDDSYTINGYLRRAYSDSDFFIVDEIQYDDKVMPIFSPEVLTQIENARAVPAPLGNQQITYDPATNIMAYAPDVRLPAVVQASAQWLVWSMTNILPTINLHTDVPGAGDVVIATRLQPVIADIPANQLSAYSANVYPGTEIVTGMFIISYDQYSTAQGPTLGWTRYDYNTYYGTYRPTQTSTAVPGNAGAIATDFMSQCYATAFRMRPMTFCAVSDIDSTSQLPSGSLHVIPVGDIHNLTVLSKRQLQEITRICVLSELNAYTN